MGWDAGVKRAARFLKSWPAMEIDPCRMGAYQNRNYAWHYQQFLKGRATSR
jgi:hypothetical protein